MKTKKSWASKLLKPQAPVIEEGPEEWNKRYGGTKMVISTPMEIVAVLNGIPDGMLMTMGDLRHELASRCQGDYACPLTTGIFLRIVAEAVEEGLSEGKAALAPWWRIIPDDRKLNPKLPGGGSIQAERLSEEGWIVQPKGKHLMVGVK